MEICFKEKKIMPIVDGTLFKPSKTAADAKKMTKVKTQARRMISSFDSLVVLENLVSCFITTCM